MSSELSYRDMEIVWGDKRFSLGVQDVPRDVPVTNCINHVPLLRTTPFPEERNCMLLSEGQHFWTLQPDSSTRYLVIMGSDGELCTKPWTIDNTPNPDYGPNIFGLEAGRQAGQFMIHTYAMIPAHESDRRYALTVVQEDGQWKLKYSNEEGHEYDWRFICKNGVFAIQWCGTDDIAHGGFVLYHEDERLHLTDREAGNISLEHFLHNFYSL